MTVHPEHVRTGTGHPGIKPCLRLLTVTQFAFNIGFYAVLPYLAAHLAAHLGIAGWLIGLVLGLRTFSQQGLFVVGGALTDRYGPRPVVLAGCVLCIAGFCWLALAGSTVIGGSAASGTLLGTPGPVLWTALAAVPLAGAGTRPDPAPGRAHAGAGEHCHRLVVTRFPQGALGTGAGPLPLRGDYSPA